MHAQLDAVWDRVVDALAPGGVACINVGDATRTVDDEFRVYQNHARVLEAMTDRGLVVHPELVWRKPANSAAKFMGSGMVPTNAYATLEHEYVLVFRKGPPRDFPAGDRRRYESAYFWEERNDWFSDVWTDVRGITQDLDDGSVDESIRDRSGAYPFAIPYRLINMYSVYGDTVLDPFLGTGTTTLAAMVAGRNSVGYELESGFLDVLRERTTDLPDLSRSVVRDRLDRHRDFVRRCHDDGDRLGYEAEHYDFPVRTKQERRIRLYAVDATEETDGGYRLEHAPYREEITETGD